MCTASTHYTLERRDIRLVAKAHLRRCLIEKALNPLKDKDFVELVNSLSKDLDKAVRPIKKEDVASAMAKLDVAWDELTVKQTRALTRVVNTAISNIGPKALPTLETTLTKHLGRILRNTRLAFVKRYRRIINTSFTATDRETVAAVGNVGTFVRNGFQLVGDRIQAELDKIIQDGLAEGLRNEEISSRLKEVGDRYILGKDANYWTIVANNAMNTARTYGMLTSMSRAGIEAYEWSSVMDERTTPICRLLDGKVFSVNSGLQKYESLRNSSADNPQAITVLMPFVRERRNAKGLIELYVENRPGQVIATVLEDARGKKDEVGKFSNVLSLPTMEGLGISMPPIHHLCRSTVLPIV